MISNFTGCYRFIHQTLHIIHLYLNYNYENFTLQLQFTYAVLVYMVVTPSLPKHNILLPYTYTYILYRYTIITETYTVNSILT